MAEQLYGLTLEQTRFIDEMMARERRRPVSMPRRDVHLDLPQAPEVYIAQAPAGGIAALTGNLDTGTGTGTLEGAVPGSAECTIYRLLDRELKLVPEFTKTIYNFGSTAILPLDWIKVSRDKWGTWWVDERETPAAVSGSLTVQEVDLSPSYPSTTTLRVDQADGFVLTQPAANVARLDQTAASATTVGYVSLVDQTLGDGNKTFSDDIIVLGGDVRIGAGSNEYTEFTDVSGGIQMWHYVSFSGSQVVGATLMSSGNRFRIFNQTGGGPPTYGAMVYSIFDGVNKDGATGVGGGGDTVTGGIITTLGSGNAQTAVWVKVTKSHTDFQAAATSNTVAIYTLAAKQYLHGAVIKHTTAFGGGSITTYTLAVETALGTIISAFDVFQAVSNTVFTYNDQAVAGRGPQNFGATASVSAVATASHNLNTSTAGAVEIYLLVSTLP